MSFGYGLELKGERNFYQRTVTEDADPLIRGHRQSDLYWVTKHQSTHFSPITNNSGLPLVVNRDREDAADLGLKLPVPDDPDFCGGCQHRRAR